MTEVWPVIHVRDEVQTCTCAAMARSVGAAGVLLIEMNGDAEKTDHVARRLVMNPHDFKIGVNYLRLSTGEAFQRAIEIGYDAFWTDDQEFTRGELSVGAKDLIGKMKTLHQQRLMFMAVAFKGQPEDPFPGDSAGLAAHYGMIPTTSGPATGQAPDVEKVRRIRAGIDGTWGRARWPLAIASGVTPENARSFVDAGATHLLVNTGISTDFHTFDESRLLRLMKAVANPERPA